MIDKNSRHHNIANGEGKWSTHVNSSRCLFSDPRYTLLRVFATK
ncbi:hypothetical protein CKO_02726 [Citrobacter koseri ATCC BAA-895]|uniref:Uncharacterized protein n=1 Tax=Citrobacter koseri (strain ATCC BAA-895 / CDC 4225-83 / SGSC4696) TaxID=290338 RepID=A8AK19_CITK8|nr:hypothetical protein CKO_02726 [Citrobacter koseri ATCC BAA-895]